MKREKVTAHTPELLCPVKSTERVKELIIDVWMADNYEIQMMIITTRLNSELIMQKVQLLLHS